MVYLRSEYIEYIIRVTLISKILEFPKAGATTSRYMSPDSNTGFRFSPSQKKRQIAGRFKFYLIKIFCVCSELK